MWSYENNYSNNFRNLHSKIIWKCVRVCVRACVCVKYEKMSGNIEEERVNHVWETEVIIMPMVRSPGLAYNPKYHKRKICLESFNSAKCKMLKHRNNEWDNPHKHQVPYENRKKKIDMCIFFNIPNLNWLKDYIKCLGHGYPPRCSLSTDLSLPLPSTQI